MIRIIADFLGLHATDTACVIFFYFAKALVELAAQLRLHDSRFVHYS